MPTTEQIWPDTLLDDLIEDAIVDAYDLEEQLMGFDCVLTDNVALPFDTTVLGVPVTVASIAQSRMGRIVARCVRGPHHQDIPLESLPIPNPPPGGAEWIAAYIKWAHGAFG